MNLALPINIWPISDLLTRVRRLPKLRRLAPLRRAGGPGALSGVANWSKSRFVVDFRNLLFGRDFDLSFSKSYSLMNFFNL